MGTDRCGRGQAGETEKETLEFDNELIGVIYDKFVEEAKIVRTGENFLVASVYVQISPTFFGWLAQFGSDLRNISIDSIIDSCRSHISEILIGGSKYD